MRIGVFYGSSTGNTERVAKQIVVIMRRHDTLLRDVADTTIDDFLSVDALICGASTWDIGELQEDWAARLSDLEGLDLSGRSLALFEMGDAYTYSWNYLDCLGELWNTLQHTGASLVGRWPVVGYEFDESRAVGDDGHFLGLGLDEDNHPEPTSERVYGWLAQLCEELRIGDPQSRCLQKVGGCAPQDTMRNHA